MISIRKHSQRIDPQWVRRVAASSPVPWGPVGYVTYKRTYARLRDDLGRTEEWHETVERCVNAVLEYGARMDEDEAKTLFEYVYLLKCSPPGRMLWQLGTPTVARIGGNSLCNCYYVSPREPEAFCFAFDMLMLGGGVGFSVLPSDVYKLPTVKPGVTVTRRDGNDVDFIVPDNREGWVELLRRVLAAYFTTGRPFTYSTHCVRGAGERIKGFGGVASGPGELVKGIAQIAAVLGGRAGRSLRPVDVLDVFNVVGSIVVSGNVRRSAQIAIGSSRDAEYLNAKRWDRGGIPNWRAMSNNSVYRDSLEEPLSEDFWAGYDGRGEPYGLINMEACRSYGRLDDGKGYRRDDRAEGVNPCAEQTLESYECCDLFEQYLPRLRTREEFVTAARLGYKVCKTVLQLPFAWEETERVVRRNQRLGIGVSGYCQAPHFGSGDYTAVYRELEGLDDRYSREIGAARSIKLTTVKPSGTVSLLPGVTPGVHPAYSRHYIRRIRFSANDPIVAACRDAGYGVEPVLQFDGSYDHATQVVSFPVDAGEGTVVAADVSAVDQLEMQQFLQRYWSDNNVSVTVYYRDAELPAIREWLSQNYRDGVKTVSFLRHSEHGFRQAPYEEITAEKFAELSAGTRPIDLLDGSRQWDVIDSLECAGGACPVK